MDRNKVLYITLVLLSSWLAVVLIGLFKISRAPMTAVMILPALLAIIFILRDKNFRFREIGWHLPGIKYFLIALLLPLLQLAVICTIGFVLNLLSVNKGHIIFSKPTGNLTLNLLLSLPALFVPYLLISLAGLIIGWLNHLGEEFAWRGFLFRGILKNGGSIHVALLITGLTWFAWHLPMFWLSPILSGLEIYKLVILTISAVFGLLATTVIYCWIYLRSGSIWAPTIMHFSWNFFRELLTGRLADGSSGLFSGTLWITNGEGLIGNLVTAIFGIVFLIIMLKQYNKRRRAS
jgi:membrane protease YdiL (CAAX protease family)